MNSLSIDIYESERETIIIGGNEKLFKN